MHTATGEHMTEEDRFKDGVQWWMDTTKPMSLGLCPNPPQWHIDTGNLVRLVPQRPWVGLTFEERNGIWRKEIGWGDPSHNDEDLMKAIEAKLKEKNT
jgi:hypothetical protein